MRANRTKRLGKDHTGSTVQQAIGLVRPMIDWESSLDLLSIYFEYLNPMASAMVGTPAGRLIWCPSQRIQFRPEIYAMDSPEQQQVRILLAEDDAPCAKR